MSTMETKLAALNGGLSVSSPTKAAGPPSSGDIGGSTSEGSRTAPARVSLN